MTAISRRSLIAGSTATVSVATIAPALGARQSDTQTTDPKGELMVMTPDQALERLRDGNRAFLDGKVDQVDLSAARRLALAKGQAPFCTYVSTPPRLQ